MTQPLIRVVYLETSPFLLAGGWVINFRSTVHASRRIGNLVD